MRIITEISNRKITSRYVNLKCSFKTYYIFFVAKARMKKQMLLPGQKDFKNYVMISQTFTKAWWILSTIAYHKYLYIHFKASVVDKMVKCTSAMKGIANLEWHQENQSFCEEPLFQTWSINLFGQYYPKYRPEYLNILCRWDVWRVVEIIPEGAGCEESHRWACRSFSQQRNPCLLLSHVDSSGIHHGQGDPTFGKHANRNRAQVAATVPSCNTSSYFWLNKLFCVYLRIPRFELP